MGNVSLKVFEKSLNPGLLLTAKEDDFGAISATEQN